MVRLGRCIEIDYAGWWDVLLDEENMQIHPDAVMVQIWNNVFIYQGSFDSVVGNVPNDELHAIRSLEKDYLLTVSIKELIRCSINSTFTKAKPDENPVDKTELKKQLFDSLS